MLDDLFSVSLLCTLGKKLHVARMSGVVVVYTNALSCELKGQYDT